MKAIRSLPPPTVLEVVLEPGTADASMDSPLMSRRAVLLGAPVAATDEPATVIESLPPPIVAAAMFSGRADRATIIRSPSMSTRVSLVPEPGPPADMAVSVTAMTSLPPPIVPNVSAPVVVSGMTALTLLTSPRIWTRIEFRKLNESLAASIVELPIEMRSFPPPMVAVWPPTLVLTSPVISTTRTEWLTPPREAITESAMVISSFPAVTSPPSFVSPKILTEVVAREVRLVPERRMVSLPAVLDADPAVTRSP